MNTRVLTRVLATLATAIVLTLPGCGTEVSEGDLPATKPHDPAKTAEQSKKLMEGMKGMYKGAPGVPTKK